MGQGAQLAENISYFLWGSFFKVIKKLVGRYDPQGLNSKYGVFEISVFNPSVYFVVIHGI